jgi:hypothetical protein
MTRCFCEVISVEVLVYKVSIGGGGGIARSLGNILRATGICFDSQWRLNIKKIEILQLLKRRWEKSMSYVGTGLHGVLTYNN